MTVSGASQLGWSTQVCPDQSTGSDWPRKLELARPVYARFWLGSKMWPVPVLKSAGWCWHHQFKLLKKESLREKLEKASAWDTSASASHARRVKGLSQRVRGRSVWAVQFQSHARWCCVGTRVVSYGVQIFWFSPILFKMELWAISNNSILFLPMESQF